MGYESEVKPNIVQEMGPPECGAEVLPVRP